MPLSGFMPRHDEDKLHMYMQLWAGAGKKLSVHNVWQGHELNSPLEYTGNTAHQCSAVDSPKQSCSLCLSKQYPRLFYPSPTPSYIKNSSTLELFTHMFLERMWLLLLVALSRNVHEIKSKEKMKVNNGHLETGCSLRVIFSSKCWLVGSMSSWVGRRLIWIKYTQWEAWLKLKSLWASS